MSQPTPFTCLTRQLTEELTAIRDAQRAELASLEGGEPVEGGACWMVAYEIGLAYGWSERGGCYVETDGRHHAHEWNVLPADRLLDVTADQFGESAPGIRICAATDARYDETCDCDGAGPGS